MEESKNAILLGKKCLFSDFHCTQIGKKEKKRKEKEKETLLVLNKQINPNETREPRILVEVTRP